MVLKRADQLKINDVASLAPGRRGPVCEVIRESPQVLLIHILVPFYGRCVYRKRAGTLVEVL